jgi:hypothetical protein
MSSCHSAPASGSSVQPLPAAPVILPPELWQGGAIAPPAQQVLARADIVFCEETGAAEALAQLGRKAPVEWVCAHETPARELAIARALRLAGDGWRVVWITSADAPALPPEFAPPGAGATAATVPLAALPQHALATGLNGLAG